MDGFRLFRRHSKGRRGEELMLHVKEGWDCMQLAVGDDMIEILWVRITGKLIMQTWESVIIVAGWPIGQVYCSVGN